MAGVRVHINSNDIHRAVGTPGGPVYEWREQTARRIVRNATATAPVNDPLNAVHRGGGVGEFMRSFDWNRYGNQSVIGARITNSSDHAEFTELGRLPSNRIERFSWANWKKAAPGTILVIEGGTSGYRGHHTLRNATNSVMPFATGGSVAPLS